MTFDGVGRVVAVSASASSLVEMSVTVVPVVAAALVARCDGGRS